MISNDTVIFQRPSCGANIAVASLFIAGTGMDLFIGPWVRALWVRHIVHCDVKRPVQSRLVQSDTQIQFSEAIGLLKEVDFRPHWNCPLWIGGFRQASIKLPPVRYPFIMQLQHEKWCSACSGLCEIDFDQLQSKGQWSWNVWSKKRPGCCGAEILRLSTLYRWEEPRSGSSIYRVPSVAVSVTFIESQLKHADDCWQSILNSRSAIGHCIAKVQFRSLESSLLRGLLLIYV